MTTRSRQRVSRLTRWVLPVSRVIRLLTWATRTTRRLSRVTARLRRRVVRVTLSTCFLTRVNRVTWLTRLSHVTLMTRHASSIPFPHLYHE